MRHSGNFDICEEAVQEALLAATVQWPRQGCPRTHGMADQGRITERMAKHHRLSAVRAHLLEMTGDTAAARAAYRTAARRTTSIPEQRYLEGRAARLTPADGRHGP